MNTIQYTEQDFIGSGSFSNVYKVTINDKLFALKKIHPYLLKDQSRRTTIMNQIQIMKQIDHPNIIKFYDYIENNDNQLNLLLQYAEGGTLYDQLKSHQTFSQQKTIQYVKDILQAVKYLHSKQYPILHRDIKPQNILLMKNGKCKLADFGSSNILNEQRTTFVGTKQYMAPQISQNLPYGKAIDLWCLGILIYELLLGRLPPQINKLNLPPHLSRPAEDVIKRLLNKNPALRMTLQQLQNHIWLIGQMNISNLNQQQYIKEQPKYMTKKKNLLQKLKNTINNNKLKQNSEKIKKQNGNQLEENINDQLIVKQAEQYLDLINLRTQLKIKYKNNKQQILNYLNSYSCSKLTILEEIFRLQQKIKEYQHNIDLLSKSPLKFLFQYQNEIKQFNKKFQHFQQYVQYLPTKLKEQVLDIPEYNPVIQASNPVPSQYILKLKSYILLAKRDALIELIAAKKRHKSMMELDLNM